MKKLGLLVSLLMGISAASRAEISVGPVFRQALDEAGVSDRAQLPVAPRAGEGASVLKAADFGVSNTNFLPEQYFKTHTVITAHVWNGDEGEYLPDTVFDRPGFTARFTDGSIKYQFIFMKVYKGEAFAIVRLAESTHGDPDAQGNFTDQAEIQDFLIPPGKKTLVKQASSSSSNGVDQGDGVFQYNGPGDQWTVSTRKVNADRSEDNSVKTDGMTTVLNGNFTLTGVDNVAHQDPIKQADLVKEFPAKVQDFLKEFSRLHWTAVFAGQILSDCLAKNPNDTEACAEQQQNYTEAHNARHEYWTKTLDVGDLASLKPTEAAPQKNRK